MAVQTVEQVKRLPPYLEGLQKRLLQSLYGTFDGDTQTTPGLIDQPLDLPDFQVAGLDPLQQMAFAYAPQMFGSFAPFIQSASDQIGPGARFFRNWTTSIRNSYDTIRCGRHSHIKRYRCFI